LTLIFSLNFDAALNLGLDFEVLFLERSDLFDEDGVLLGESEIGSSELIVVAFESVNIILEIKY